MKVCVRIQAGWSTEDFKHCKKTDVIVKFSLFVVCTCILPLYLVLSVLHLQIVDATLNIIPDTSCW